MLHGANWVMLTTGHDSFSQAPWINKLVEFTTKVLAQDRVRVIGVCFGHQIVGRALGVKVGRNDGGWEAAVNDVLLTEKGKEIFGKDKLVSLSQMVTCFRLGDLTFEPESAPNAPRYRLLLSRRYRASRLLACLQGSGYVWGKTIDHSARTPRVQRGDHERDYCYQARHGNFQ